MAAGAVSGATGSGLVRPLGGRPAGRVPEVAPFLLAVPALGQVEDEVAAAVPGGAGGDRDQVAADRGGAGLRAGEAGQAPAARRRLCAMAAAVRHAALAAKRRMACKRGGGW